MWAYFVQLLYRSHFRSCTGSQLHTGTDSVLSTFAVTNPFSIFWSIEMWGYGFLGLGTFFAVDFFSTRGIEGFTRFLFLANGIVSLAGSIYTSFYLEWVLSTAGLVSYAIWNLLYLLLAIMFLLIILRRRSRSNAAFKTP
jgi:hypothetical protein